jgi:glyoxylase-like metal-dependent hydrolase (beta-lactamase superfamily II)
MDLLQIKGNVYYIPGSVNIGLIKQDDGCILIDSGLHDDTARKVSNLLIANKLKLKAIINTHSHADHCGGNCLLKERTGCKIYAPIYEAPLIENTFLEPIYLFSGAHPIKELDTDFLKAKPSKVDAVINKEDKVVEGLNIVNLSGHSINQIGISYENVLFCADSFFSEDILQKHKIPYCHDIKNTKETLVFLKESRYDYYLPSHGTLVSEIIGIIEANIRAIENVEATILLLLKSEKTTENVVKELCEKFSVNLGKIPAFFLMQSTIMAYLSSLAEEGKITYYVKENSLFWALK